MEFFIYPRSSEWSCGIDILKTLGLTREVVLCYYFISIAQKTDKRDSSLSRKT